VVYLVTQILFCLAVALLAGAAIGWLINGHRAARREHKIREELIRQSLALNQSETDNKMIEDDYRELKYRSEETVVQLKEESKQLPILRGNLEKSQLLVRQMLQKHEAGQRQLTTNNNQLATRLQELDNREHAVAKLQMELNTERLQRQQDPVRTSPQKIKTTAESSITGAASSSDSTTHRTELSLANLANEVEAAAGRSPESIAEAIAELEAVQNHTTHPAASAAAEPTSTLSQSQSTVRVDSRTEPATVSPTEHSAEITSQFDFGSSEREDNLQEIFGIGPVTQKTLRKLGIVSFEQLARLDREHVEYIAGVLGIFSGRIERDGWVGSARKRVEQAQADADKPHRQDQPELEDA